MKKINIVQKIIVIAIAVMLTAISICILQHKNDNLQKDYHNLQLELNKHQEEIEGLRYQLEYEFEVNENLEMNLAEANATIANLKREEYEFVYMGDFKLTHYCKEKFLHICGEGHDLTATGTKVTPGRTIAVDPSVIPYGTKVYIEGYGWRTAEDCGGAVNGSHIDIAVDTHDKALSMGTKTGGVWLLVKNGY